MCRRASPESLSGAWDLMPVLIFWENKGNKAFAMAQDECGRIAGRIFWLDSWALACITAQGITRRRTTQRKLTWRPLQGLPCG